MRRVQERHGVPEDTEVNVKSERMVDRRFDSTPLLTGDGVPSYFSEFRTHRKLGR